MPCSLKKLTVDTIKAVAPKGSTANCDDCGTCEAKCPNTIPTREQFAELLELEKQGPVWICPLRNEEPKAVQAQRRRRI